MKKFLLVFGVLLVFLSGCGSGASGDEFVFAIKSPIESLDLAKASYKQTFELFTDIYATVTEVDENGELINGLATDISVSDDNLIYTINLRDDAVWVDNTGEKQADVIASDFVFSWRRMVDPSVGALYSFIFEPVKNAKEITAGQKDPEELGIQAIDDYTLQVELETPTPYFESLLAFSTFGATSEQAQKEYGQDFATSAQTMWYNGPFYVSDYKPNSETKLVKNPLYYDQESVQLENITYKVVEDASSRYNGFKTGELDYAELINPTDIADAKENGTLSTELSGYSYYSILNTQEEATTGNENLRKALSYGFNRDEIENSAHDSTNNTIEYIVPEGITEVAYDGVEYRDYVGDSLITYDKDKAEEYFDKYMEDMGYSDRSQIVISYLTDDAPSSQKVAESVQAQYKQEFGIDIQIKALPFEQYVQARTAGDFDMLIQAWGPDFADPSTYLGLWTTDNIGGLNDANYANDEYDQLYAKALDETDVDKRFEQFGQLEKMLIDDNVLIPFYQLNNQVVITDGYTVPSHLFLHISHKYVTQK